MNKKLRNQQGFTIIELLIVIIVIGILAALVLNTFQGVQERARDTERKTDINAVASQLEVYHAENSNYPLAITDTSLFPGLDEEAVVDPDGNGYSYVVYQADGTTVCTVADDCQGFELSAAMETDQDDDGDVDADDTYVKDSLL